MLKESETIEFKNFKRGFSVIFYKNEELSKVEETTQKTTQKILDSIKENKYISRKELAEKIGITEDGIKFQLNNLKKKRLLKRIGPDKGGYWKIKED